MPKPGTVLENFNTCSYLQIKNRDESNHSRCGAVAVEIIINDLYVIHQYIMLRYFIFIADKKIPTIETQ